MNVNLVIPLTMHELASTVWIGGMFFAHFALRPTLKAMLEPKARVEVAIGVYRRFFPWVWIAIAVLWMSGFWIGLQVLASGQPPALHIYIMAGIAFLMTLIFTFIYAFPYRMAIRIATVYENWRWAGAKLSQVRALMAVNLTLGVLNLLVAATGPVLAPDIAAMLQR